MSYFTQKLSWDLTLSNANILSFAVFPSEILCDNRIKRKKRKRVSFSTSKLAVRRWLDEVTRAKLSRASCVTRVARSLSFSSLLVIVAAGQSLDFSQQFSRASRFLVFSRAHLFGSVYVHGFAFHAKIRTGSLMSSSSSSLLPSSLWPSSFLRWTWIAYLYELSTAVDKLSFQYRKLYIIYKITSAPSIRSIPTFSRAIRGMWILVRTKQKWAAFFLEIYRRYYEVSIRSYWYLNHSTRKIESIDYSVFKSFVSFSDTTNNKSITI